MVERLLAKNGNYENHNSGMLPVDYHLVEAIVV